MAGNYRDGLKFAPVWEIDIWMKVEDFQWISDNPVCLLLN